MSPASRSTTPTPSIGTEGAMRVADVLLAVPARRRQSRCHPMARSLDLSKAVVHRVLQSMVARDLLTQDRAVAALPTRAGRQGDRCAGTSRQRSSLGSGTCFARTARRDERDDHVVPTPRSRPGLHLPIPQPAGDQDARRDRSALPFARRLLEQSHLVQSRSDRQRESSTECSSRSPRARQIDPANLRRDSRKFASRATRSRAVSGNPAPEPSRLRCSTSPAALSGRFRCAGPRNASTKRPLSESFHR
jgi:hypothetical protein